jgi:hypothetical protein
MKMNKPGIGKRIKRLGDAALIAAWRGDFTEYWRIQIRIHMLMEVFDDRT